VGAHKARPGGERGERGEAAVHVGHPEQYIRDGLAASAKAPSGDVRGSLPPGQRPRASAHCVGRE
jgi:hypothetical protein